MKGAKLLLAFGVVFALLLASCRDSTSPGPGNQANDRISIVNDAGALLGRVTYYADSTVPLESTGIGYSPSAVPAPSFSRQVAASQAATTLKLKLEAEVAPPTAAGQTLQATSVTMLGSLAVVSYNMRGAAYLGAIDVFEISKEHKPTLKSQAIFLNTDVNAVSTDVVNVFAAEATSDASFTAPGVFELVTLSGSNLVLPGNQRFALSSFAGTSSAFAGNRVYATSGDAGSLFAYDVPSYTLTAFSLHDARWVAVGNGKVVVVQGTPGQIAVYNESNLSAVGTFPFTGADVAESKSTVEVVGGKAFIAAGTGGVQVLSASTGSVVGSIARPDAAALGLDPSVVVTNAASVDQDLVFISNGEAGVYVAQGSQAFSSTGSETTQTLTMLGRLGFGNLQSVNHVAYRDGYLFIAAGLGGLKIVKVN